MLPDIIDTLLISAFHLTWQSNYNGLNSKQIEKQKIERMFKDVGGMKNARKIIKKKKH